MRKYYPHYFIAIILCSFITLISCSEREHESSEKKKFGKEEEGGEKREFMELYEAWEFERTKDPATGLVPRQHLLEAYEEVSAQKGINQSVDGALPGIVWNERGPGNVGGRTRSILIDKNDPSGNTIFAGSVGGGLWKCTNFTTANYNWRPVDDLFPNLAVTAIAQNPVNTNVMYFGTGEGYGNTDALQGGGVWKSVDGGTTWIQLTATDVTSTSSTFSHVQKILVKQVGGTEYLFVATRNAGIQRSTDGGVTFAKVNLLATSSRAADLDLAKNGDIYAGMGLSGSGNDGIYRSTDNGDTWVKSVLGLPLTGFGRVKIAVAPGADSVIYATLQNSSNNRALGIYKSTNFGVNWSAVTNANAGEWASNQAWYGMIITVDPDNPNHVIIGGLDAYSTLDGGNTWTAISSWFGGAPQYMHADHHEMKFYKTSTNKTYLYFGNDGGVFFSSNAADSIAIPAIAQKDSNYNVTQFFHGSMGPAPKSNQFLVGAQDNGTQYFTSLGLNRTREVTGGDGAFCHIDDDNSNIQISQYVYNYYWITNNNWASYSTVEIGSSAGRFINPTDYDSRTNTLYGAYSTSAYSIITNVGTTNNSGTKATTAFGSSASAVRVSPNTVNRVFFGTQNGRIVRVDNANTTPVFTNITASIPATGLVSEIAVQEGDDNHIIYCISNYGTNSVWETTNGGTTWTSIEGNFTKDVPVRAIMFSPNNSDQAFIGTDIGVYSTDDINGTNTVWGETNSGLARVSVQHLEYRRGQGTLMAVTHGRGMYTSTSLEVPAIYFQNGSQELTETQGIASGCRNYTDITVPITLSDNPGGAVQIRVTPNALSTASVGVDYDILTPMPLTFSSASTQNISVRIYNDAAIEPTEQAVLEIAVINPGSTNVRKGAGYLNYITITDNDKVPDAAGASVVIYTENWESGIGTWSGFGGGTATAPNVWGLFNNCSSIINNQTAVIYNSTTNTCGYNADIVTPTNPPTIYQTINATGRNNLSIEFDWKGVGEVGYDQGQVVFDTSGAATPVWRVLAGATALSGNPGILHLKANLPSQLGNRTFRIGFQWNNDNNTGDNPAFAVDNIQINSTLAAPIQLAVNAASVPTNYVGPFETVPFYDNSGRIMATIKNNNNLALGCVKVEVDRAGGNGNIPFWSADSATYLASKTYKVTAPDAPVAGVSYDITLYYTPAEINTWAAQSRHTDADPKIIKISNHSINEVSPASQYTSDVTVSPTATKVAYNFTEYSYTATFNSFSGFGLGVPTQNALPITLLDFKGELGKDKAVLSWTTSTEYNNKGFYLERSVDGRSFSSITYLNGYGTSVMPHSYSFNDFDLRQPVLYYRLKQVDIDGRFTYSRVVQLQVAKDGSVRILPNPFKNSVQVLFGEKVSTVNARLVALNGSTLLSRKIQLNGQSSTNLDFSSLNLLRGDYILKLEYNDKVKQVKLMKE